MDALVEFQQDHPTEPISHWDQYSKDSKRQYLKNLGNNKINLKDVSDGNDGYMHFEFGKHDNQVTMLSETILRIRKKCVPDMVSEVRDLMDQNRDALSQQFKIHLQPKSEYIPEITQILTQLFESNPGARELSPMFKVSLDPARQQEGQAPEIVVYSHLGRDRARKLLSILLDRFKDKDYLGSGITPRGNLKISNLIYLAQSDGRLKDEYLRDIGLLDEYFDKNTNYALMNGERAYWSSLIPNHQVDQQTTPDTPESPIDEALEKARLLLEVAQAIKMGRAIPMDEKRKAALLIVRQRLVGEPLDSIIIKSAANVRGLLGEIQTPQPNNKDFLEQAMARNQLLLKIAQIMKRNEILLPDENTQEITKIIAQRLANGEPLDDIIKKTAANIRGFRARLGIS